MSCTVVIHKNGQALRCEANKGETLLSLLRRESVFLPAFCGGKGLCGKCRVVASGALSRFSKEELSLLSEAERAAGVRLACGAAVEGDAEVSVPADGAYSVLTAFGEEAERDTPPACWEQLGAAVDIGTTTIAVYIYSLETRRRAAAVSALNRQQSLGADVISRIGWCLEHENGEKQAQQLITRQLAELLGGCLKAHGLAPQRLRSVAVAANTTMLCLLCGSSPASLSAAPFEADDLFGRFMRAGELGIEPTDASVYLLPSVSAFVGADITAGILSSGLYDTDKNILMIDFGTNGEMVLASGGRLLCCSTAAGPAFEGAKISCGCGGVTGAINSVELIGGRPVCATIGGGAPVGLAGSGLIDAAVCMLESGATDESGYTQEPYELAPGVTLLPRDIRELQLAKAAVRAGAETLLARAGLTAAELDEVLLTGGFGANLDTANALRLGLLPQVDANRVRSLGNAAGAGAVKTLLEPESLGRLEDIVSRAQVVPLDTDPVFAEGYIKYMGF